MVRRGSQIRPKLSAASPTNRPQPKVIITIVSMKLKLIEKVVRPKLQPNEPSVPYKCILKIKDIAVKTPRTAGRNQNYFHPSSSKKSAVVFKEILPCIYTPLTLNTVYLTLDTLVWLLWMDNKFVVNACVTDRVFL